MRRGIALAIAALGLTVGGGLAATTSEQLAQEYADDGYSNIRVRVKEGYAQVKAYRNGEEVEAIYSLESGQLLKIERETAAHRSTSSGGSSSALRDDHGEDDDGDDDHDDDRGRSRDRSSDRDDDSDRGHDRDDSDDDDDDDDDD